jgi:hypothetical protein
MQFTRRGFASHPSRFGRAPARHLTSSHASCAPFVSSDVKLFATTFAAGFLFVSILIG